MFTRSSTADCGACCRQIGTPPGYAAFYPTDGEIAAMWKDGPDYERWLALPVEIERELHDYYRRVQSGELLDRSRDVIPTAEAMEAIRIGRLDLDPASIDPHSKQTPIPCLWFDTAAAKCKHYEHRPETCRDAIAPGDESCLSIRKSFRIPLPTRRA